MRFAKKNSEILEADLTPMIDMTFQLIAFFMIVINFSDAERAEQIQLPKSAIAKPVKELDAYRIILNLDRDGSILFAGQRIDSSDNINGLLRREVTAAQRMDVKSLAEVPVIIRAHEDVDTGLVQKLIDKCQEHELETFRLRVMEKK
jgi:biopolymer transport protein ExbD